MPISEVEKIWFDGELVDWKDAQVHVLSHALHYGSGVFEGIRAYETERGPAVWHLDEHLKRLFRSAKLYHMDIPYSLEAITQATKDVILANGLNACYIRPLVIRGYGEMGVNPLHAPVNTIVAVWPWGAYLGEEALDEGVRVKVSSWKRNDQNSLPPAAKASGQYINSILAKREVQSMGYDEAIMLDGDGYVAEGSGQNLFIVRRGQLITPPVNASILAGITRDSVIRMARDDGLDVVERMFSRDELYISDEAFFAGTATEVTPVREVDGRPIGSGEPGPITRKLQREYFEVVKGEKTRYQEWLTFL